MRYARCGRRRHRRHSPHRRPGPRAGGGITAGAGPRGFDGRPHGLARVLGARQARGAYYGDVSFRKGQRAVHDRGRRGAARRGGRGHRRGEPEVHLGRGVGDPHRGRRHRLCPRSGGAADRPSGHQPRAAQHGLVRHAARLREPESRCPATPGIAAGGHRGRTGAGQQRDAGPAGLAGRGRTRLAEADAPCGPTCRVRCGWRR